jgi:hypothetical protein
VGAAGKNCRLLMVLLRLKSHKFLRFSCDENEDGNAGI